MAKVVEIPYGEEKVRVDIPEENLIAVTELKDKPTLPDPKETIRNSIENPIKSDKIPDLVGKDGKVVIAVPDIVHPGVFKRLTLEVVLEELHSVGVGKDDITIIDAVGLHRMNTKEELELMLSKGVVEKYRVINHDAKDKNNLVDFGKSEFGHPVAISRLVAEADLFIGIADIIPAPTAGYSGGSKLTAVGVASAETITHTHGTLSSYWHSDSKCGVNYPNPFREHMDAISKKGEAESHSKWFSVHCAVNSKGEIIGVYSGDLIESWKEGCLFSDRQWKVPVPRAGDIVVFGTGYPNNRSPYWVSAASYMLLRMPKPVIREGGVAVLSAPCDLAPEKGTTEYEFIEIMRSVFDVSEVIGMVNENEEKGLLSSVGLNRAYGAALIVAYTKNVFIAGAKIPGLIRDMFHTPVKTVDEGLKKAFEILGSDAGVLVIPNLGLGGLIVDVKES